MSWETISLAPNAGSSCKLQTSSFDPIGVWSRNDKVSVHAWHGTPSPQAKKSILVLSSGAACRGLHTSFSSSPRHHLFDWGPFGDANVAGVWTFVGAFLHWYSVRPG
ncbi:hypothetical protein VFPPC_15774 [Pochonia chlamydosporia 170]|uniref:Uncharacterized protein n=1 Tax=Pochonia chlamydosporia 170 TaxID=1380566 RepID=A0A179FR27_METCM|nr:hypothetical protein VFPPC_15774 [Pochonia chlamydosporia 170]OAQ68054.2 hypothetical protein VFPPC_15774 [Pochonia chlamydosporia 170]